jgi:hypothetical protein
VTALGGSFLSGGGARQGRGGGQGNRATCGGRRVTSRGPGPNWREIARAARQRLSRGASGRHDMSTQWGGTKSLMSGARLAVGRGQRRGVHGAWADPGRNEVGRAWMNSNIWDLFKSISS